MKTGRKRSPSFTELCRVAAESMDQGWVGEVSIEAKNSSKKILSFRNSTGYKELRLKYKRRFTTSHIEGSIIVTVLR